MTMTRWPLRFRLAGLAMEPLQRWHAERRTAALDEAGR